ncbi:MAG TPA: hypothetical protein VHB98_07225, partial [Chloroflexota bacterium]|nr:hypothetical protein [Chloroflexota bacterium]
MLRRKLAIPAAAIVLLGTAAGFGGQTTPTHAQVTQASYSGSAAITDYQFPVASGMGGNTTASVADAEVAGAMIDSLVGLDAKGNFFPDLVTQVPTTSNGGIKVVAGNEVVTYHVKPGLKWSDGQPI